MLNISGRSFCFPIANETRLDGNVVALSAESVETNPPASTINAPNGRKYSAASIIPSSPKLPMNSHDGIPNSSEFNPPMKTNVNMM